MYEVTHGNVPEYLPMLLNCSSQKTLSTSSAGQNQLGGGDRAFEMAAPTIWNCLPINYIGMNSNFEKLKKDVKTCSLLLLLLFWKTR